MEQAHLIIVNDETNEVYHRDHRAGDGCMKDIYSEWLNIWVPRLSSLSVLKYAKAGKDFDNRLVAELFLQNTSLDEFSQAAKDLT
jgi:hypothetical protein